MIRSESGSVLIAGMFMGVILVLCCLHMVGVCEAILVRALGQNIADAVALEGAVWHAQGMNLIVLINLIMAAVMALFITIRLAQIILITAIAVLSVAAAIASFFSWGAGGQALRPIIQRLGQELVKMQRREDKISQPVMKTLSYGAEAERLLAAIMPYVSLARPVTRSADLPGLVVGISLVPAVLEQKFSKAPQIPIMQNPKVGSFNPETSFPARMGTLPLGPYLNKRVQDLDNNVASKGLPPGLVTEAVDLAKGVFGSLPVQEEDAYQLCARAGEMVVTFFPSVFSLDDEALNKLGAFAGVVFGSLQTMTCTPLKELGSVAENEIRKASDKKCQEEEEEDIGFGIAPMVGDKPYWTDKRRKQCRKDKFEKAKADAGWKDQVEFDSLKVARLWGIIPAPKNSPFLHVWSLVPLHRDGPKSRFHKNMKNLFGWDLDDAGVANADVANPQDVEPADAMGEFRHVCDGGGDAAGRSCSENSMWRPGWYAKLVPVRDFSEEMRQKLGDALAGWFSRALGKAIASSTNEALKRFVPDASQPFIDKFERHLGVMLGQRMLNNWFNRRFLTDVITNRLGIQKIEALTVQDYPEHLH
jgi:hypothetical protein